MPEFDVQQPDEDAVLKEVWATDKVEAKTELNSVQIQAINKMKTLSKIFNNDLMREHLKDFMVLQKSLDRKSMGEFVAVVKAKREDIINKMGGFGNNMMG